MKLIYAYCLIILNIFIKIINYIYILLIYWTYYLNSQAIIKLLNIQTGSFNKKIKINKYEQKLKVMK